MKQGGGQKRPVEAVEAMVGRNGEADSIPQKSEALVLHRSAAATQHQLCNP